MLRVARYITKNFLAFLSGGVGFPKRGLKFIERWVFFLGLQDERFLRHIDSGLKLRLSFRDHIEKYLLWYGEYESTELNGLIRVMNEFETFIDVGANIGYHSLMIAKKFPRTVVYSIEPAIRNYEKLVQHIRLNEAFNVKTSQIAFSDKAGIGDLYIAEADNSGMSGLSKPDNFSGICEQIKITSFDNWAREMGIGKIDTIKVDVEGAELAVLRGMLNTIQLYKPILALEIVSENLRRFDQVPGQIYDFLSAHAYVPYRPVDDHAWELVDFGSEGDLIFFFPPMRLPESASIINP